MKGDCSLPLLLEASQPVLKQVSAYYVLHGQLSGLVTWLQCVGGRSASASIQQHVSKQLQGICGCQHDLSQITQLQLQNALVPVSKTW